MSDMSSGAEMPKIQPEAADDDEIGGGDLGEGVETADDRTATPSTERKLDKGLKETFPASDPVSINPGAD